MKDELLVYYKSSERFSTYALALILIALPIGLFIFGWFTGDYKIWFFTTLFGVFAASVSFYALRQSFTARFTDKPMFVITGNGIEIQNGKFLDRNFIKEAVIFNYESDRLLGVKLKDKKLEKNFSEGDFTAQLFGFAIAVSFSSMNISEGELVSAFVKHQIPIKGLSEKYELGDEKIIQQN